MDVPVQIEERGQTIPTRLPSFLLCPACLLALAWLGPMPLPLLQRELV